MPNSCYISLLQNGLNQILTIPYEFALPGTEVLLRKEGDRLIIEPIRHTSLLSLLATLEAITEHFPDIDEGLLPLDDITL
jgi:antitoxin VapB